MLSINLNVTLQSFFMNNLVVLLFFDNLKFSTQYFK